MVDQFDFVAVVDWSAANKPTSATRRNDAIWVGVSSDKTTREEHFRTRHEAEHHIRALIATSLSQGQRALVGFDFAFGYPSGFATSLTDGSDIAAVWRWLAGRIEDGPDNRNNRFAVAAEINARFGGIGPFWSHPTGLTHQHLPRRKVDINFADLGIGEFRAVERQVKGAKSPWMLYNPGAVGSQSLLGLPMIHRLSQLSGVEVWPFSARHAPVVLAEVYPSLLGDAVAKEMRDFGIEKDRAQVRLLSRAIWRLSRAGKLATLLNDIPEIAREEGWILGVVDADRAGHVNALMDALR